MIRVRAWLAGLAVGVAAGHAAAQAGWIVAVQYEAGHTSVNPAAPRARVVVSAYFPPGDFAFAAARWHVHATEAGWSEPLYISPIFNSHPGVINGPSVLDMVGGQIHFPPTLPADTRNPIPVWMAQWRTVDFGRRSVGIVTETTRFEVYVEANTPRSESRIAQVVEGHGEIRVTPAPGAVGLLGMVFMPRRRR